MDLKDLYLSHRQERNFQVKGVKCRALKDIRCHQGMIKAFTEGTVQYELENIGRTLINVRWSNGISVNVFENEIEIIE
jgi:hypothetical protein